jgi:hypothetical protein
VADAPTVPYPTAVEKYPTVRQSRLATFDACPLEAKFDLEYRRDWSGHPQARGQLMHRCLAKCLALMAELEERTIEPEVALSILRETLRQADVEPRDVVAIPFSQIKDMRWVVVKWANDNIFDTQFLADIEQRFSATLRYPNPAGGWVERTHTGQVDVLFMPEDDWAVCIDWKDTWALPPSGRHDPETGEWRPDELSEEGYFQQRDYAFLIMETYPAIQRVTLREHYVRYSESREATVFRSELENVRDELSALIERFDQAVEHGVWPLPENGDAPELWKPAPGAHCNWCPRPTLCPIFPDVRVQGAITDPETAERWAAEQIVAKAAVAQRDKALRAWATARGPIPVYHAKDPNRVLGFRETLRTSRPTKAQLERALAEQGADLDPDSLFKEKTSTRFEPHTNKGKGEEAADAELVTALEESIARGKEDSG